MSHTLEKRGPKHYRCTVCEQEWTIPSKARCPRIRVVSFHERGTFMSQTELSNRGYKIDRKYLPEPTCCYRSSGDNHQVVYTYLYDSTLCVLKKPSTRRREVHYVETLSWPKAWLPFLEESQHWNDAYHDNSWGAIDEWERRCLELARMASSSLFFTAKEFEAYGGDVAVFTFPLTAIRTQWPARATSIRQAQKLIDYMLREYRSKWRVRPPRSDVAMEVDRRMHDARECQMDAKTIHAQEGRYSIPPLATPHSEPQPPAVQLPLWDGLA